MLISWEMISKSEIYYLGHVAYNFMLNNGKKSLKEFKLKKTPVLLNCNYKSKILMRLEDISFIIHIHICLIRGVISIIIVQFYYHRNNLFITIKFIWPRHDVNQNVSLPFNQIHKFSWCNFGNLTYFRKYNFGDSFQLNITIQEIIPTTFKNGGVTRQDTHEKSFIKTKTLTWK